MDYSLKDLVVWAFGPSLLTGRTTNSAALMKMRLISMRTLKIRNSQLEAIASPIQLTNQNKRYAPK
jgi:hypothetical protein